MKTTTRIFLGLCLIVGAALPLLFTNRTGPVAIPAGLPQLSLEELAGYDGSNTGPIYIGMNGAVYDVTAGRKFYEPGGVYHFLAGRDSSKELNLIGGDIIAKKYPVVARLK